MPNTAFIWPDDRAWRIANDVDPHWAGSLQERKQPGISSQPRGLDLVRADLFEEQPSYR